MSNLSSEIYEQLLNPSPIVRYYFLTTWQTPYAPQSATGPMINSTAASSVSAHTSKRLTMWQSLTIWGGVLKWRPLTVRLNK